MPTTRDIVRITIIITTSLWPYVASFGRIGLPASFGMTCLSTTKQPKWKASVAGSFDENSGAQRNVVKELLKQPFYQDIKEWLDIDVAESIGTMEREDVIDMFRPNSTRIGKALRLWNDVKARPEAFKVIHVHKVDVHEAGETPLGRPTTYRWSNEEGFNKFLISVGASGLCTRDDPYMSLVELRQLVNGSEYWLDLGETSAMAKLQRASKRNEAWQDNYQKAWMVKVNTAIPGLFEPEGYVLVQLPFRSSGRPHNCEIDGIFLDLARKTVVVVEGKSGSMDISDESEENLARMAYEELRELKRKGYADAQLLACISAIKSSNSAQLKAYSNLTFIPVLAPWLLSPENEERARTKTGIFRFVRPDESGIRLWS